MSSLRILKEARALVEKGWTQNADARNKRGAECPKFDKHASAWCITGAMDAASYKRFTLSSRVWQEAVRAMRIAINSVRDRNVECVFLSDWNDVPGRKKEEVLAVFDKAIESLQERASQ